MTNINVDHFKKMFLEMKEGKRSLNLYLGKGASGRGDDADMAQQERERALELKLNQREAFYNRKIDQALEKIENGTFGECEECGGEINEKRLLARPTASMCIHCKEEHERGEEHILYAKRSKTLGKEFTVSGENISKAYKTVSQFQAG